MDFGDIKIMRKIVQVTEGELISLITIAMIKFMDRLPVSEVMSNQFFEFLKASSERSG